MLYVFFFVYVIVTMAATIMTNIQIFLFLNPFLNIDPVQKIIIFLIVFLFVLAALSGIIGVLTLIIYVIVRAIVDKDYNF